jgi:hypothetical protein
MVSTDKLTTGLSHSYATSSASGSRGGIFITLHYGFRCASWKGPGVFTLFISHQWLNMSNLRSDFLQTTAFNIDRSKHWLTISNSSKILTPYKSGMKIGWCVIICLSATSSCQYTGIRTHSVITFQNSLDNHILKQVQNNP